jgi:probable HAF family extracellular repeat protein
MPRLTRLAPAALVLLALAAGVVPPAGAAPEAREVTRTVLPPLPGTDPAADTEASDIDNHGRIVGSADGRPVIWHDGEVVELTGFPDDVVVPAASEINDRGQVVAVGYTAAEAYPRNYLWQDGRVQEIELGPGLPTNQVHDFNERGQALVTGHDAAGRLVFGLWQDGHFTEVGTWVDLPPGPDPTAWRFSGALRLSDGGHIATQQIRGPCPPSIPPPPARDCESRPVVWHDGELTVLPGGEGDTFGVNVDGDVIGMSDQHGGVVWRDGQAIPLGFAPHDINDRGQIVGTWRLWTIPRVAVWEDGRAVDLGTLGGWSSGPFAINESGQVVGYSQTPSGEMHVFLWDDGGMVDLTPDANAPLPDPWLVAMNDHGQVVGYSETRVPNNAELWEVSDPTGS